MVTATPPGSPAWRQTDAPGDALTVGGDSDELAVGRARWASWTNCRGSLRRRPTTRPAGSERRQRAHDEDGDQAPGHHRPPLNATTQSRRVRLRSRARFVAAMVAPMTDPLAADPRPSDAVDAATMRRLLLHEARVHAIPGRDLRDLGDSILLHDPVEREPFWNRLEGLRWPDDPAAFDKRLTEILVLFASIGRHAAHLGDAPPRFAAGPGQPARGQRVPRHGHGQPDAPGRHREPALAAAAGPIPDGVSIERLAGLSRARRRRRHRARSSTSCSTPSRWIRNAGRRSRARPSRRSAIRGSPITSSGPMANPAAVARRATFEGLTYLSSIGTAGWARGRGLGTPRHADRRGRCARGSRHDRLSRGLRRQPGRDRRLRAVGLRAARAVLPRHAPLVTPSGALERILDALAAAPGQPIALGWATVELDRAASELAAELGFSAAAFLPASDSIILGARCRVAYGVLPGGQPLAILEPRTEGRLAGSLARRGEGPVATWSRSTDSAPGRHGPAYPGPFGPERLRPGEPGPRPVRTAHRGRAGYHRRMTDQATILFRPAAARRRRGDRRDVHR